jgi:hypothetical protein
MPESNIIEQQRSLVRAFHQTITQIIQVRENAAAHLKSDQEAAESAMDQVRERANKLLENGRELLAQAQNLERESGIPTTSFEKTRSDDPDLEMRRCVAQAYNSLAWIKSTRPWGLFRGCLVWVGIIVFCAFAEGFLIKFLTLHTPSLVGYIALGTIPVIALLVWLHDYKAAGPRKAHYATLTKSIDEAQYWHQQWLRQAREAHERTLADIQLRHEEAYKEIEQEIQAKLSHLRQTHTDYSRWAELVAPAWNNDSWHNWSPPIAASFVIRLGEIKAATDTNHLEIPTMLTFPGGHPLLLKVTGGARALAFRAVQSLLVRLLTANPPGKIKFTFIDPIGLGQNIAPFMHLADYDETLVNGKVWTESQHIEQRLADLTEHMENVIQKYLRNEFATIEDYNAQAGEVAEPYRILVVLDFPVNFSEAAARRLVSIAQNGQRCGVYAVITFDDEKPLPHGFSSADLEQAAIVIAWDGERFVWHDEDFENCQLELDSPPDKELFDRIIKTVGEAAQDASKVEVPFERITSSEDVWWTASSRSGLRVPLGPTGARKIQYLDLGQGTAQHALIAGKTGSGKSTLLHVLITNLALAYSPDEVELYLVDFKKGVEFKTYATHQLPHARVVAIESEREFGLSVLQGLDTELKRRGDLFRSAGVDGLADYRQRSNQPMPRILLLVDEFQEFFTEDDSIASQASQILDRLVRQGRAFGIHVLLGSQTLAGAYSLARSTIDQMAVRIALQCSEADSRLILADDNPAARLLSRPGEAIYNAANGLVEGNNRFQIAWLPDEQREQYLKRAQAMSLEHNYQPPNPQIVFEGNAPAEVEKNRLLHDLLVAPTWPASSRRVSAWLGDPIAIREPVAARFRQQSGSNLLIVGQNDEAALGMMAVALISLTAQHAPQPASRVDQGALFYILDFSAVDASYADVLTQISDRLPHSPKVGRRRHLPDMINELHIEVQRRLSSEGASAPPTYLFIYGLQRARDLRQEEGFGFTPLGGDESAPPNPAQQFATILRDGPDVDVHTVVWCDNSNNLNRTLDRRALREFEMKVVFQMNAEDSSNLIDTPAASKLGTHRALFYNEEEGQLEKFRPYGLPSEEWLIWAGEQLRKKHSP